MYEITIFDTGLGCNTSNFPLTLSTSSVDRISFICIHIHFHSKVQFPL